MVSELLQGGGGQLALIAIAILISLTALVLLFYGLSKKFTESIDVDHLSRNRKYVVHALAYAGYFSRGVILGVIGFFLFKAALTGESEHVVNTDKAFDFIGDHIGAVAYWLIAVGTICYGLYMFILGLNYEIAGTKRR